MALTSQTIFDIVGQTQTITFYNPSQVDQIVFANNQITFQMASSYNLIKSDLLLYLKFLNVYNNLLFVNFPSVTNAYSLAWPLCQFDITETSSGVTHLDYTQTSQGSTVLAINYVPQATSGAFTARGSPITISLQEFFMTVNMLNQYSTQVSLN